jgi:tetratricopeptide (TPR) repeat protein
MRGPEFSTGDGPTGLLEMALTPECQDDDDDLPFNFDTLVERLRQGLPVILPGGLADPTANREKADLFQQAHAAHSSGRWAEAASLYEAAEGAGLPSKPCRYNRALCHYESEDDLGEAIRLFSWCIDQNTHVAECLVKRASARLLQLNEDEDDQLDAKEIYAASWADCDRLVNDQRFEDDYYLAEGYNQLGYILYHQDRYEEALAPLAKALEIDDDHYNANSNMGKCLWHLDRNHEAIPYLKRAIEIDPDEDYPYELLIECYDELIDAQIKKNRLDEAHSLASKLIQSRQGHKMVAADTILASKLRTLKRPQALEYPKRATEAYPSPGYHFMGLGQGLSDIKDMTNAVAAFNTYAEFAPEDANVWQELAMAHFSLKNYDAATRCTEKAVAADEASREA